MAHIAPKTRLRTAYSLIGVVDRHAAVDILRAAHYDGLADRLAEFDGDDRMGIATAALDLLSQEEDRA